MCEGIISLTPPPPWWQHAFIHAGAHTHTYTTAVWVNNSSTLWLAITAEGHRSAEGLSSRKEKKAWFLCNLNPELAGAQESCSSQASKTRTQPQWLPQPHTFINTQTHTAHSHSAPYWHLKEMQGKHPSESWTLMRHNETLWWKEKEKEEKDKEFTIFTFLLVKYILGTYAYGMSHQFIIQISFILKYFFFVHLASSLFLIRMQFIHLSFVSFS